MGERDHWPPILSSEARRPPRTPRGRLRASSASRPASVLPPGEATARAHVRRVADPEQLGGPGGGLDDQLARQLLVEAGVGAGVGQRFDRERQVGGGAAHHRGRGVEGLVGELDDMAEQPEQLPHLRAPRRRPRRGLRAGPRRRRWASPGSRRRPGNAASIRASGVAPSSETTVLAPSSSAATSSSRAGFTASTTTSARSASSAFVSRASPPRLGGQVSGAPRARVGVEHPVDLVGPARRHCGSHAARSTEADNHDAQPR